MRVVERGRGGFKPPAGVDVDSKLKAKRRRTGSELSGSSARAGINPSDSESCGSGVLGRESATNRRQCTLRNTAERRVVS